MTKSHKRRSVLCWRFFKKGKYLSAYSFQKFGAFLGAKTQEKPKKIKRMTNTVKIVEQTQHCDNSNNKLLRQQYLVCSRETKFRLQRLCWRGNLESSFLMLLWWKKRGFHFFLFLCWKEVSKFRVQMCQNLGCRGRVVFEFRIWIWFSVGLKSKKRKKNETLNHKSLNFCFGERVVQEENTREVYSGTAASEKNSYCCQSMSLLEELDKEKE